ncbi:TetR family transcriptional regulator [uncultured Corynebacterium sp.]|uniref:TetR family transcriptional regulator n=1 Tax=uncultured Corynebacterium sp. TaxID=159447 RepID=UPI00261D3DF2|nr:TetR family transcriptional regulator [uncultured Corynebacterium sp.]
MQLTKDIIMDAALEILDEFGLQDLTIRRLARHLDAAAGAMYWHFPSKQALLGAVADRLLEPLREFGTDPDADWRANARAFAVALHDCLTSHRDGAEVVSAALATGTATVRPADLLTPMLADAPALASADDTGDAAATLVYFILGATVDEQTAGHLAEVSGGDAPGHSDRRIANGTALILAGMASEA